MPAQEIVTARSFLNALDKTPGVFEPLSLETWLELSLQRRTHPLCVLFARQCGDLLLNSRDDDLGMLTLRQLSKLSEDLLYFEQKETTADILGSGGKRQGLYALAQSRIGNAAAIIFVMMYEDIHMNVIPNIKLLLLGKHVSMDKEMVDALLTYNEDLGAAQNGPYAALLSEEQHSSAKRNIAWVNAFREYLPRIYLEYLARLPAHPLVVERGEDKDVQKLTSYGKQLMARCLRGVFLLPENHRLDVLKTLVTLGSNMEVMMALRPFTGQGHLLANVPLSLAMSVLEKYKQSVARDLYGQLTNFINGDANSNSLS